MSGERPPSLRPVTLLETPEDSVDVDAFPFFTRTLGLGYDDRYEVQELLGKGSMGEVWRVHDRILRRDLAMKVATAVARTPNLIHRFHREAVVTAQLSHPVILPVFDTGVRPDGFAFYTMPVVEGRTLEEHLADEGWETGRVVAVLLRAAGGLAHAHARGVVHRDVKPANLMIGAFGEVVLTDWGLVKVLDTDAPDRAPGPVVPGPRTKVGAVAGTPRYMSPEQAVGMEVGTAADVYAIGAILYESLTGRPTFDGTDPLDIVHQVRTRAIEHPVLRAGRPLPEDLVEITVAATERRAADRPTMLEVVAQLERWLDGRGRTARATEAYEHGLALQARGESEEARRSFELAVSRLPEHLGAHRALADLYRRMHEEAEAAGDAVVRDRAEAALRHHVQAVGAAELTAATEAYLDPVVPFDVPVTRGSKVALYRLTDASPERIPLERRLPDALPPGDYVLHVRPRDAAAFRYRFHLVRRRPWVHRGRLPHVPVDALGRNDVIVPGGPVDGAWLPAFVVRRYPVTTGEYARFLASCPAHDDLVPDDPSFDGPHATEPSWPVVGLTPRQGAAFLEWVQQTTGQAWRWLSQAEWDRAMEGLPPTDLAPVRRPVDAEPTNVWPVAVSGVPEGVGKRARLPGLDLPRRWAVSTVRLARDL
jgi:serine/threonine-protein kinase